MAWRTEKGKGGLNPQFLRLCSLIALLETGVSRRPLSAPPYPDGFGITPRVGAFRRRRPVAADGDILFLKSRTYASSLSDWGCGCDRRRDVKSDRLLDPL